MKAKYLIPNLIGSLVMVLMAGWTDVLLHAGWRALWDLLIAVNLTFCLYCELKDRDET